MYIIVSFASRAKRGYCESVTMLMPFPYLDAAPLTSDDLNYYIDLDDC